MQYFTMGTWVLGLSLGVAVAGALVGLICIRQSTLSVTAKFRLVWLTAAAVCIGAIGTHLGTSVTLLGVGVGGGTVHYDLLRRAAALILVPVAVLAALLIVGRNPQLPRLAVGALVMGLSLGAGNYFVLSALEVQGTVSISPAIIAGVTVLSVVVAFGLLYAMRLRATVALLGVAMLYAAAIVGMHYLALSGLQVHLDPAMPPPGGQDLFTVFIPVFAIGVMSLAIPITAVLVAPDRAGRLQPEPRKPRQRRPRPTRPTRPAGTRRREPVG
ncbi:hypothetical protein KO481_08025 [Nocardia sp. NEAU-G5]|uniref:MHYT domain-containing protein n=1 Tax=Nocardia albiluteola TaxID=2842303 RepID=A0ABS6AWU0_9NOCA|nr:hypothetical protein [Nocardia albiluteola]MBU3061469.1 hypothetical protein [Nocardia albiluteola]